jgi:5-methylcytosine-specific restriction endonuclease McrA
MAHKTPPFKHWPAWTQARFWGFIRSGLREKFNRYPPKYEAMKAVVSDEPTGEYYKTGHRKGQAKTVKRYLCASCGNRFRQYDVQVDHIVSAGSLKSFADLPGFTERLFCGVDDLQILCKPCHERKTQEEKK